MPWRSKLRCQARLPLATRIALASKFHLTVYASARLAALKAEHRYWSNTDATLGPVLPARKRDVARGADIECTKGLDRIREGELMWLASAQSQGEQTLKRQLVILS